MDYPDWSSTQQPYDTVVRYWDVLRRNRSNRYTQDVDSTSYDSDDDEPYAILHPEDDLGRSSSFFRNWMPAYEIDSSSLVSIFCKLRIPEILPCVGRALVKRFSTDLVANWKNHTLRSLLELSVWLGCMFFGYRMLQKFVLAFLLATSIAALVSAGCEFLSEVADQLLTEIRRSPLITKKLQTLGFDFASCAHSRPPTAVTLQHRRGERGSITDDGAVHQVIERRSSGVMAHATNVAERSTTIHADTTSEPLGWRHLQVIFFGYCGWCLIRITFESLRATWQIASALTLTIVALFVIAELLLRWQPIRRYGVALESRWTYPLYHWKHHPLRSLLESTLWLGSVFGLFHCASMGLSDAFHYGTILAGSVCALNEAVEPSYGHGDQGEHTSGAREAPAERSGPIWLDFVFVSIAKLLVILQDAAVFLDKFAKLLNL